MERGQVVTFYSYKGGVGRTMALANVAWLLAVTGKRVLMIDWDLEAPGLHRYFYPFLDDPGLDSTNGLLEVLWEYIDNVQSPRAERVGSLAQPLNVADASRVAVPVRFDFTAPGALHLIGAGRQNEDYPDRLYRFAWQAFYDRFGGAEFIDHLIEAAKRDYDFILIDSRTGVADTSGICTIQIPDQVILCFTYNRQSVEGTAAVGHVLREMRPELPLLLRPMRVVREVEGLTEAREFAHSLLGPFLPFRDDAESEAYWQRSEIPHYSAYAFEETLAAIRDVAGGRNTLLADMEVLTSDLMQGAPIKLPRLDRALRERLLRRYRLRDPRQVALTEAMELEPSLAQRRVMELAAEAQRRYRWDQAWISQVAAKAQELSDKLGALGRQEEAQTAGEQAVELYRYLASARPDAFRPELAGSLTNLAIRLSGLGRREAALAAAEEAAAIRRELAAALPDAFRPDLALSLAVLANCLDGDGHEVETLAANREAIEALSGPFLRVPEAFAHWMAPMVQQYLERCEVQESEPDGELLEPLLPALEAMAEGAAREREEIDTQ